MSEDKNIVLDIKGLQISFRQYDKGFHQTQLDVIRNLDVKVPAGKIVAVVGSSGSGKSLLAHAVMGILPYNATVGGEILYKGEPLTAKKIKKLRGEEIMLVPQSTAYLDPLMKTGKQICKGSNAPETVAKLDQIFKEYELDSSVKELYPFELSGGMTRRVMISTALMGHPNLVIADEPTTALDAIHRDRAVEQFWRLQEQGCALLIVTHDFDVARYVGGHVLIMKEGEMVEQGRAKEVLQNPQAAYTRELIEAIHLGWR